MLPCGVIKHIAGVGVWVGLVSIGVSSGLVAGAGVGTGVGVVPWVVSMALVAGLGVGSVVGVVAWEVSVTLLAGSGVGSGVGVVACVRLALMTSDGGGEWLLVSLLSMVWGAKPTTVVSRLTRAFSFVAVAGDK
jgi:hypothetical protein